MTKVVRYDQLFDQLRLKIPSGVPVGVMLLALRDSGKRFCSESSAWVENLTPLSTVANQLAYTIINPWQADIIGINRIGLRSAAQIAADADDNGSEIAASDYSFFPATQKVKFASAPASEVITNGLLVNAVLIPQFNSDEIAEWFFNMYQDGIIGGAVNTICSMPQYFNEKIARTGSRDFTNDCVRASRDIETNYTTKPYRIKGGYNLI
jgi:hypothetical protein